MRVCTKCSKSYTDYGQRSSMCKDCKRCYDREYHRQRSEQKKKRKTCLQKQRKSKLLADFREWKKSCGCNYCQEDEPICLDLHHLDPNEKDIAIADALSRGWSWDRLMLEASKCIVVCSNCHRKIHEGLL